MTHEPLMADSSLFVRVDASASTRHHLLVTIKWQLQVTGPTLPRLAGPRNQQS
jgi:hypothetical protein